MAEVLTQLDVAAPVETVWQALTTQKGIESWWTTRAEVPKDIGGVIKLSFPDAPVTWDLRIDDANENSLLRWHCVGGPPPWIETDILFRLEPQDGGGTRVVFDHVGWRDAEEMVRIVTWGWVHVLSRLKSYAETNQAEPFFDF